MNSGSDEIGFYTIRGLLAADAARLIVALEHAGIEYRAEFVQEEPSIELEGDSGNTEVIVCVDDQWLDSVRKIENDLFGTDL